MSDGLSPFFGSRCGPATFARIDNQRLSIATVLKELPMRRVLIYSALLIMGMALSQLPAIDHWKPEISALTMIFLAYIMIQVGMEFEIDKNNLRKYGVDYLVAMAAAAVPWLTAAAYFWWFFQIGTAESLLIGRFAAPTSAGILFTMLAAAGLAAWASALLRSTCYS